MPKKKLNSIDKLAAVTQKEFLEIGQRLIDSTTKVDAGFKPMADVLGPLVRTVASLEETVRHLDKRVARLEEKAIAKQKRLIVLDLLATHE